MKDTARLRTGKSAPQAQDQDVSAGVSAAPQRRQARQPSRTACFEGRGTAPSAMSTFPNEVLSLRVEIINRTVSSEASRQVCVLCTTTIPHSSKVGILLRKCTLRRFLPHRPVEQIVQRGARIHP